MFAKVPPLKIVIVGHVDHGKSTLIGRLLYETGSLPKEKIREIRNISKELGKEMELAFLMDHLKEERERAITIDSAQIPFHTKKRDYVIIDAPGHVEFTKNMLTGASQAEAALLLIDANEGVREQTRRHAYLLQMIGIRQVMVVINKMDLVHYQKETYGEIKKTIVSFLRQIGLSPSEIIPISAREGVQVSKPSSQMPWYKGPSVLKGLDGLKKQKEEEQKGLRLPVQDVYDHDGKKMIVGKIVAGSLKRGTSVIVLPDKKRATVQDIFVSGKKSCKRAVREENVGLLLSESLSVKRGDVLAIAADSPDVTQRFDGNLFWLAEEPIKVNKPVTLRSNTQKVQCVVESIHRRMNSSTLEVLEENAQVLKTNEVGVITFETVTPIVLDLFSEIADTGRFVIDEGYDILGAGIVTHISTNEKGDEAI